MFQNTFMKTVNIMVTRCNIITKKSLDQELVPFNIHCFRRGGVQHRNFIGKQFWPFDVVKWCSGWGTGDDMNTVIRYLLEEITKYESIYAHFLYTRASDD